MRRRWRTLGILCLTPALLSAVQPEAPFVCSLSQAVECDEDLGCQPPQPELTPPSFLHVDVDKKVVTLLAPPERRGEQTAIHAVERLDGRVVLSGIEAGRGWSLVVEDADGAVTMAGAGFVVFGHCISVADASSP